MSGISELCAVELSGIEVAVGARSFNRGRGYARGNRVVAIEWDPVAGSLTGSVVGQGALYSTSAFFVGGPGGELAFDEGECTCPVGYNCKHVAAIVVAATNGRGAHRTAQEQRRQAPTGNQPLSWERPLRALIDAPTMTTTGNPLAIELALQANSTAAGGMPRLMARLMRPGARGGWVKGSLTWSGLDSWHVQSGEYRQDHLALLGELYAVYRACRGRAAYYYDYGADKTLDLSNCSAQLWSVLDEATRIELALVDARPRLGELGRYKHGELVIDVTHHGDDGALVTPVIRVDGSAADLEPLLFLGSAGHGIVCADASSGPGLETCPLHLVRLARPAAPPL